MMIARRADAGGLALKWGSRTATLAWAGFWAWFVVATVVGEVRHGQTAGVPIMAGWLVALTGLTVGVWRWPRIGGPVLMAAAVGAAVFFANPWAQLLLALPAFLVGAAAAVDGFRRA